MPPLTLTGLIIVNDQFPALALGYIISRFRRFVHEQVAEEWRNRWLR